MYIYELFFCNDITPLGIKVKKIVMKPVDMYFLAMCKKYRGNVITFLMRARGWYITIVLNQKKGRNS